MATTIPVIKGMMGSTEYYIGVMAAGELIDTVGFASEISQWKELSIEERMQRELDRPRVVRDIVPYLQSDPDHFFGSLIVDVYQGWENLEFEELTEVANKVPRRYAQEMDRFGFLHMPGERRIIALDGQHRLKALQIAIKGDADSEIEPAPDLSKDLVSVIFIKHEDDNQKIRKIFNKVNRYAKQTGRGDNIITSEDDPIAIIARRLLRPGEPLAGDLVNWRSNTLSAGSVQFTTISAVYDTVETILGDELAKKEIDKQTRPPDLHLDKYYVKVAKVWKTVIDDVDEYQNMLNDAEYVKQQRKMSLLFKPAAQMALFRGLKRAMDAGTDLKTAVERINGVPWDIHHSLWANVMVAPNGNIDAGKAAKELASRIIAYYLSKGTVEDPDLLADYQMRVNNPEAVLPDVAQLALKAT